MSRREVPTGLLKQVDEFITKPDLQLDTRARHFYPSSASCKDKDGKVHGACLRSVALDYYPVGKSNPHSAETMYTFEMGRQIESMYIEWFKRMGIWVADHVKFFNPDFYVSGELDIVLREYPGSPTIYGGECKSSYGDYFKMEQITGRAGKPPAPKDDHLLQVALYLDNFPKLPYFRLFYLGRDKFDRIEYCIRLAEVDGDKYPEVTRDDGSSYIDMRFGLARIYNRYKDLMGFIKRKELPPTDFRPTMTLAEMEADHAKGEVSAAKLKKFKAGELLTADWRCTYCSYKNLCRSISRETIPNFVERYNNGEDLTVAVRPKADAVLLPVQTAQPKKRPRVKS